MYIAFTRKKYKDTYHEQVLLRESYREDGKVKTRTIANFTNQPKEQVEAIVIALKSKGKALITTDNQFQGLGIGLSMIILFIMKQLGMIRVIGKSFEAKIAIVLIAARITIQSSRLQALYWAKGEDKILDLCSFTQEEKDKLNDKTIYKGLDYIYENQESIENRLFKSYYKNNPPKRVFYDVTSSYVEGEYEDSELVTYGYNRDKKQGKAQIVIGALTDEDGHAISIQVYPGNTNDVKTFTDQLDKLKHRFKLEGITIVGDGGMIKSEDIAKIEALGYDYITSIGKPSIQKLIEDKDSKIEMSLFDEKLQETVDEAKGVRYILRQNPTRRDEIRETRASKIKRAEAFIQEKKEYYNTHYKAKKETMVANIDKKIASLKLSKFISYKIDYQEGECIVTTQDNNQTTKIKALATVEIIIDREAQDKIEQLDGCYIVTTSLTNTDKDTKEEIHQAYKTLIKVENAFKTLKTEYLEIRPLYLRTDSRIKAHIFISMLSYNIVLKLRGYISDMKMDLKSTIREISNIKTVRNVINKMMAFETIPAVDDKLKELFDSMNFKLPNRI